MKKEFFFELSFAILVMIFVVGCVNKKTSNNSTIGKKEISFEWDKEALQHKAYVFFIPVKLKGVEENFKMQFDFFGLKKLISTHYKDSEDDKAYALEITEYDKEKKKTFLKGDGDFRSTEVINYLKEADIVVTNPPFSLFGEFITQLINFNKKFLIIGPILKAKNKTLWPYIMENKVWLGYSTIKWFKTPTGEDKTVPHAV